MLMDRRTYWRVTAAICAVALVAGCSKSPAPAGTEAAPKAPAAANETAGASDTAAADLSNPANVQAANAIKADDLRRDIAELSDDRYEGREPGTKGDELARAWIARQLEAIGLQPGGPDGGWQQPFELVGIDAKMPKTWTLTKDGKSAALKWWDDYMGSSGVQRPTADVRNAEVVFVGYGIQAPEFDWNDYKDVDLKGKVLLMLNNDPDWDPALFQGKTRLYYGRWDYKYASAARQGAAAAIVVHTRPSAGYPWQVIQTSNSGEQFELPARDEPRLQLKLWVTEDAARKLVALGGQDLDALVETAKKRDFRPVPLGVMTSLSSRNELHHTKSANVLGLLRGSDPKLAQEVVVITAHHDHLGVGEPDASGDRIYNGALDNASGVAQVLAIARAMKALPTPPKRSILFNLVGGEEADLLGSQYYAENPTFPAGRIAANINYDGGNIWGRTRDVTYIGKGKSSLDAIVDAIAKSQGRVVKPDQMPDRGYFYRSDQLNFAKIGVPALYLDTGFDFIGHEPGWGKAQVEAFENEHYHQPSDEIRPDWNYDGMIQDAQLGFWTAVIVGDAPTMPTWVPGDEFEAARKAAIASAEAAQPPHASE
jgi:Zn-dependent M28 family amino/carboxypeptidase